ncbi:unnamed protein product [Heligmosomoides polygyrus]|uniref:Integrase_H2C2 domain-containing protein n=1 Tax=Heligmosomoides polygyrus TaxID=6339 RepID=A0A183GF95_HELPZ|nr:unnamed protein product [Heligmosomoides polygyrus]
MPRRERSCQSARPGRTAERVFRICTRRRTILNARQARGNSSIRTQIHREHVESDQRPIWKLHQTQFKKAILTSSNNKLNIKKDCNGIYRCYGRLGKSLLSKEAQLPVILAPDTDFAKLVIQKAHGQYHCSVSHTMANVQQQFWIPRLRKQVKMAIRRCVPCQKFNNLLFRYPEVEDLPSRRAVQTRPFNHIGLDMFGPLHLKGNRDASETTAKTYGAIFTCATTRLIHLELLPDASTSPLTYMETDLGHRPTIRPIDFIQKNIRLTYPLDLQIWQTSYLIELRAHHQKGLKQGRSTATTPRIGQVVLVMDSNLPRSAWSMGRITTINSSREVELISSKGRTIKRPINLLIPLELEDHSEEEVPPPIRSENASTCRYSLRRRIEHNNVTNRTTTDCSSVYIVSSACGPMPETTRQFLEASSEDNEEFCEEDVQGLLTFHHDRIPADKTRQHFFFRKSKGQSEIAEPITVAAEYRERDSREPGKTWVTVCCSSCNCLLEVQLCGNHVKSCCAHIFSTLEVFPPVSDNHPASLPALLPL